MSRAPRILGLLVVPLLVSVIFPATVAVPEIPLGFLLPFPTGDAAVPVRLADEWISAARVALEVLAVQYGDKFTVRPVVANSNCNSQSAADAAERLIDEHVIGVVGPACSEAVAGANRVFNRHRTPFVSFAATADKFARAQFDTFFRTVYGDTYQVAALQQVIKHFGFKSVFVLYSDETYGHSIAADLQDASRISDFHVQTVPIPFPAPTSAKEFEQFFLSPAGAKLSSNASTLVVVAAVPVVVEGLWKAALRMDLLRFPWWYLVTDGGVAFDLVGAGDDAATLSAALQGEMGIGPYHGPIDASQDSPFTPFRDFWAGQAWDSFPGLLTLPVTPPFTQPRAYVLQLIDAVWAFHVALEKIIDSQGADSITSASVLQCLSAGDCVSFDGVSGRVAFDPVTGTRSQNPQVGGSPARFLLQNLVGMAWEDVATWQHEDPNPFTIEGNVTRPGPFPTNYYVPGQEAAPGYTMPPGTLNPPPQTMSSMAEDFVAFAYSAASNFNPFSSTKGTSNSTALPSYNQSGSSSSSSQSAAVAGLVIASVGLVVTIAFGVWWYLGRRNRHPAHSQFQRV